MKVSRPKVVALVGPAGAGKTTVCRSWTKLFPEYVHVDDLAPLLEFLRLDRAVADADSSESLEAGLRELRPQLHFVQDLADEYLRELDLRGTVPAPRYCKPIGKGAMEVANPEAWDDIMVRLAATMQPDKSYVVEFARGHDSRYLERFGLPESGIYARTLNVFRCALPSGLAEGMTVMHVHADYDTRLARNLSRAQATGQFTPEQVMHDVFNRDVFNAIYGSGKEREIRFGVFQMGRERLPVVSVPNDVEMGDSTAAHFNNVCSKAMEYFCRGDILLGQSDRD